MKSPRNYYNEFDPKAAACLRDLIAAGLIPDGDVDERSIEDVTPAELHGYTQCHFFAGIGGWVHALDLAGWPRDRPAWTGSCPCQPFSSAGQGAGFADERHLWPAWQHLIAQCRPAVVFGEQVASKAADAWIDLVHADMEGMGYAFGSVPFPAAGIGAPHIRDRNYWVAVGQADSDSARLEGRLAMRQRAAELVAGPGGVAGRLADGHQHGRLEASVAGIHNAEHHAESRGSVVGLADLPAERHANRNLCAGDSIGRQGSGTAALRRGDAGASAGLPGPVNGVWANADWIGCRDGKWRPVEPGTFPLAHGLPVGMGKLSPELRRLAEMAGLDQQSLRLAKAYRNESLRGYGNAIVPEQAAQFVIAVSEALATEVREAA